MIGRKFSRNEFAIVAIGFVVLFVSGGSRQTIGLVLGLAVGWSIYSRANKLAEDGECLFERQLSSFADTAIAKPEERAS